MPIFGVDRERLVRVLQNLIENAGQHPVQDDNVRVGTRSMKATTGTTPPSGALPPVPPLADAAPPDVADASLADVTPSKARAPARPGSDPELSTADAASGSNIDQLRDIIFGGQMREYERRFARMEERMAKELADVREELRDRCTTLEQYVRDELESLTVELRASQQSRAVDERRLSESIVDTAKSAEERIATLSDLVGEQYRELRAQLEQMKTITDDVERRHADLLALVERDAAELRDTKADRTALSALFMEVALRLRGESVVPGESGEPRQE
jgi:signal transduction histidine kinase